MMRNFLQGAIVVVGGIFIVGLAPKVNAFTLEEDFNQESSVFWRTNASAPPLPKPGDPNPEDYYIDWRFGWLSFYETDPNDSFMMSSAAAAAYRQPDTVISTWLISREIVPLVNGAEISFDTKQFFPDVYPRANRLEVRYNVTGSCRTQDKEPPTCEEREGDGLLTPEDSKTVGDYTYQFLKDDGSPLVINPDLLVDGYPDTWTKFTGRISGLTQPAFGRIGIRYFVTEASFTKQSNGSFIGVDNIQYNTPIPTPAMLPGLIGLGIGAIRKRRQQQAPLATNSEPEHK
jgi:hypothetical protein